MAPLRFHILLTYPEHFAGMSWHVEGRDYLGIAFIFINDDVQGGHLMLQCEGKEVLVAPVAGRVVVVRDRLHCGGPTGQGHKSLVHVKLVAV